MRRLIAPLTVALLAVAAAPAGATPTWLLPAQALSTPGTAAPAPQTAADNAGDVVVAWAQGNFIDVSVRHPAGTFSSPQQLGPAAVTSSSPRVAMDARGDAVLVWFQSDNTVDYAYMPAGQSAFGAAHVVGSADANIVPAVAIDGAGDPVVLWQHTNGTHNLIYAAFSTAGGPFGTPVPISDAGFNASAPQVAMNANGDAAAVWLENMTHNMAMGSVLVPGQSFSSPVTLTVNNGANIASAPDVAIDAAGDATAVWQLFGGTNEVVQYSDSPAGGKFSSPGATVLTALGVDQLSPVVADDAAGETAVAWNQGASAKLVQRRPGGPFPASAQDFAPMTDHLGLAFDAAGDAVLAGLDANANVHEATASALGGSFVAGPQLSAAGTGAANPPSVALDATGDGLVVWGENTPPYEVEAVAYDPAGPVLSGLNVPATATVGQPVAMSINAFDVWAGLGPLTWNFGDRTPNGSGLSTTHVYSSPGVYTVQFLGEDAVDNATLAQAQITVQPVPPVPPVPPPVLAKEADVAPTSGTVLIRVPGSKTFVPLSASEQIAFGSVIDATHGTVTITAIEPNGTTESGEFYDGEFALTQARKTGLVTATLAGGTFKGCPAPSRRHAAFIAKRRTKRTPVRSLWGNAHGNFQTRGRYASASVTGTQWFTQDQCDGTYVKVTRHVVLVIDFPHHDRHVNVHQGHSYLAVAPGY